MRKDVALLRPGDSITLTIRHRDWLGEYPMHCHNTVHEDHAMLLLWEVVDDDVRLRSLSRKQKAYFRGLRLRGRRHRPERAGSSRAEGPEAAASSF